MIRYSKKYWGLHVLFRMYGSAFPRALPFSLASAALAGFLAAFFPTSTTWDLFKHPYPFQTFAFIAGFMVVFRSNLSYGRYWEGRTMLQQVTSKLTDAVVMSLQFDATSVPAVGATQEQIDEHDWFRDTFVHLISLMHAVALATLREDFDMENLVAHDSFAHAPPFNIRRSDLDGLDGISEEPPSGGSSSDAKQNSTGLRHRRVTMASTEAGAQQHLPEHRKAQQEAGKRSFLDYFILRTDPEHALHIHNAMKLPVIGGFTQAEGEALGAFVTSGEKGGPTTNLDLGIHGLILGDGTYAPAPTERVHTVLAWVQQVLIERIQAGGVKAAPPIQSRIHQVLSDSMLGYEQCKKLTETPFPFPWAQAVNIVLLIFCMTLPIIVVAFTRHPYVAASVTFIAAHTHVMLNEVARDIEDPFHYDPNELPLPQMQYKLNERLLAVSRSKRPLAFTDVGDLTGPGNTVQMPSSGPAATQGSTSQPGTIQAGPATATGSISSTPPIRTPTPPPGAIPPPSPSAAAGCTPGATVSPPASPAPPSGAAAPTSGSITAQLFGAPTGGPGMLDASGVCEYSTANVPQDVTAPAMRWRALQRSRSRRSVIKRHSSHARMAGTDDAGTESTPSVAVPSPDVSPMQTAPSVGAASLSQRGSRRSVVNMLYRGRHSDDVSGATATPAVWAPEGVPGGEPNQLQVIVAADDTTRRSGGASEAAPAPTQQQSLSFAGALPAMDSAEGGRGVAAVSLAGEAKPLQADPGPSPFIDEKFTSEGEKAVPATEEGGRASTQDRQ